MRELFSNEMLMAIGFIAVMFYLMYQTTKD